MESIESVSAKSVNRPSLMNAGFVVIEVFEMENAVSLSSKLSEKLGTQPTSDLGPQRVILFPPRPTLKPTYWRPAMVTLSQILSEDVGQFGINATDAVSNCESVLFSTVVPPAAPYLLLLVLVQLDPSKLSLESARMKLQQTAVPFRLFVEKLNGLSLRGMAWKPGAACISWANVAVDERQLSKCAGEVLELNKLRDAGVISLDKERPILESITNSQPLSLSDPAFPVESYIMPAENLHVIIGQSSQPAFGRFRTPCLVWLASDEEIMNQPEGVLAAQFLGSIGYSNIPLPIWLESMLTWLVSLNIWTSAHEMGAFELDQKIAGILRSLPKATTPEKIDEVLYEVSQLGSAVAVEERAINSVSRWSSSQLTRIIEDQSQRQETPLFSIRTQTSQMNLYNRQIAGLAELTQKSMQSAAGSISAIESEIGNFQRHVSDLATLESRKESLKLNKRLELITKILVVLTAGLLGLTAVLAASAIFGK